MIQAVVVLQPGMKATAEEIIEHCKKNNLAGYTCPRVFEFWSAILKSVIGKVLKKDVKKNSSKGRSL